MVSFTLRNKKKKYRLLSGALDVSIVLTLLLANIVPPDQTATKSDQRIFSV